MGLCASCSTEIAPGANFCPNCGARTSPEAQPDAREVRKTVTILFSDLAGSTALGERLDPEQLRGLMQRYFREMASVIERHGGTVEKFIGDAIMAVFGIPVLHEDDALRAVRAASEMRVALAALNAELAPRGLEIRTRTGVNTGEVVAGSPGTDGTLVTGDAVNTAARLEQAAEADEILIGEATYALVRDAVSADEVPPLTLRGKAMPVVGYRLGAVLSGVEGHVRRSEGPLIGRRRELALLRQTWDRVVEERSPQLFTLLGAAGVGKSRLASEFLAGAAPPVVLRGRCLPYGEGITYWPLAEVVRAAAGVEESDDGASARGKIKALTAGESNGPAIAARLEEAIGLRSDGGAPQEELFWAVRRTLEALARSSPLIVVWDDLHWAEPTFLDLVEHLADWARDVPLLILAMARPELLELRPGWGGGKLNATAILLEPLPADASADLLAALPGGAALPDELRMRIADAAEGNPLFLEEMLGMLVDEGRLVHTPSGWETDAAIYQVPVPPTISALLASRLDRLGTGERGVAERAAVVGRIFERAAVTELSPAAQRSDVGTHLLGLVRKELVRPEAQPGLGGDDAFRFRHLLIRDAAYEALPKVERARLHEAFAGWLEQATGDRADEYEEVIAHHLEQAYGYRLDVGELDAESVGRRAGARLISAASRAQARGDLPAAVTLRRRAARLPVTPAERAEVLIQLAYGQLDLGDWDAATAALEVVESEARSAGNDVLALAALVGRRFVTLHRDESPQFAEVIADARRAAAELESAGDAVGVARALSLLAFAAFHAGDYATAGTAWRDAAEWAARSGDRAEEARILPYLPATATYGWATTSEAIAYCHSLAEAHPDSPMLHARLSGVVALQHAMRGEGEAAIAMRERSRAATTDLASPWLTGEVQWDYADVELLLGDPVAAEREALLAHELRTGAGFREAWATILTILWTLRAQESWVDARAWLARAERTKGASDPMSVAQLGAWRALLSAVEGDAAASAAVLKTPVPDSLDPSERASILELQAHALAILGDRVAALERAAEALMIYDRKEQWAYTAALRKRFAELPGPVGPDAG